MVRASSSRMPSIRALTSTGFSVSRCEREKASSCRVSFEALSDACSAYSTKSPVRWSSLRR